MVTLCKLIKIINKVKFPYLPVFCLSFLVSVFQLLLLVNVRIYFCTYIYTIYTWIKITACQSILANSKLIAVEFIDTKRNKLTILFAAWSCFIKCIDQYIHLKLHSNNSIPSWKVGLMETIEFTLL